MYSHTFFSNPNTKPIIETVGKPTSGHKAQATNLQNIEFLCFEFLRLVELLSDTVRSTNLHHFLGIYATFLGNLRHFSWEFTPFGEKFTPIYTTWWPGAETSVNPRKLPAWPALSAAAAATYCEESHSGWPVTDGSWWQIHKFCRQQSVVDCHRFTYLGWSF